MSDQYKIGNFYEYDDGVKVDGTYYVYEGGKVFTYSGPLEDSSGKWKGVEPFPISNVMILESIMRTDFSICLGGTETSLMDRTEPVWPISLRRPVWVIGNW